MADFSTPSGSTDNTYPKAYYAGSDNSSVNFVTPYKVNTGATRGSQKVKGTIEVVDATNVTRMIIGYKVGAF